MEKKSIMILRFRDLIEDDGNTIFEHNKIIQDSKNVWWGWWAKKDEKIPLEQFSYFNRLNKKDDPIVVYLFDTGNKKLFKTKCEEIIFSTNGERIESPEKELTPKYYNGTHFFAWYKFNEKIIEVSNPETELCKYSYYLTKSTLENEKLKDQLLKLDNKVIAGLDELQYQDRTIWFARPKKITDKNEKLVFNQLKGSTKNLVDQEPQFIKSKNLLWLSDIHFSSGNAYKKHAFSQKPADSNDLQTVLLESLRLIQKKIDIGAIIVSGDLAYTVDKEEFDQAFKFLNKLNAEFGLEKEQSVIIPGNHDLKFEEMQNFETRKIIKEIKMKYRSFFEKYFVDNNIKPGEKEYDQIENEINHLFVKEELLEEEDVEKSTKIQELTDDGKKEYLEFCERYFEETPNDHLYSIRRFITKDFVPLEIIGINSLALQQYRGRFQGMGYIGDNQIRQISEEIINFEKKFGKPNRIIVIHQHIMPVAIEKPDFDRMHSLVLDSEKMIEKLVKEFDVKAVLHGHTHKDFYSKQIRQKNGSEKYEFSVIGIGSVGVSQSERGSEPNVYGLIEVNKESITIKIYEVSSENNQRKKDPKNIYKIEL